MSVEKLQKEVNRWEGRLGELQQKAEQEMARANTLETERRALALAAAEGDEKAEKAMNRKAAEADEARRQSDNFALMARQAASKLETLRDELAEAKWQERLTALRQMCERRAAITPKVERAVDHLIGVLREVQSSSEEIVNLARQFDDRFASGDARRYFTTSLGYVLWALQRELRESTTQDWRFQPRDPKAGVQDALVKYDQWCMDGLLTVAGHGIEAARQARRRARGSIQVQAREHLYRARHRVIGVRGLDLQPGEVVALRREDAAALGEAVEPADKAAEQVA